MQLTESAKAKLWQDIASGMNKAFGCNIGEAFHIDQYRTGSVRFTEALEAGATASAIETLEKSSPAVTRVRMTPMAHGYESVYAVDIDFDPAIAESVYSDGKNTIASIEQNGKKYMVNKDGNATEVEDPDKYVANLNKSTGSHYRKESHENLGLADVVKLANEALQDTGCSVELTEKKLTLRGSESLIKPTQQYLPAIGYDRDTIEGGYDPESGDIAVDLPDYASDLELELLRDFLVNAVNYVIDQVEATPCSEDDEWCQAYADAAPDESYVHKLAYLGESFVGNDKAKIATLVKSVCKKNFNEGKALAERLMGKEISERLLIAPKTPKITESNNKKRMLLIDDEMALLDKMHESAMAAAPEKRTNLESLVEKNVK